MVIVFLPYASIKRSIKCLDDSRLGKQRVECKQIIDSLIGKSSWSNHPASLMFRDYIPFLKKYYNTTLDIWEERGKKNNMERFEIDEEIEYPWFWGWREFHYSHQASLIRKHPYFYYPIFSKLKRKYFDQGYIWPSKIKKEEYFEKRKNNGKSFSWFDEKNYAEINYNTSKNSEKSFENMFKLPELEKIFFEKNGRKIKMKKKELFEECLEKGYIEKPFNPFL